MKNLKNLSRRKKTVLAILVSLFLLCISSLIYILVIKPSQNIEDSEKESIVSIQPYEVVTYSTDKPDEKEPEDFEVPDDIPKSINMRSINTKGYIQQVGIDQDDNIAVPSNVRMAGWYINSSKPGEVGLSIITGHRDGVMKKGIFRYLGDLKEGDRFEVEYGDGSLRYFKVIDVKEVSLDEAFDLMYEKRESIESQLNLITCSGTYNKEDQSYDQRTIVISEKTQ